MKRLIVLLSIVTVLAVLLHLVRPGEGVRVYLLVVVAAIAARVAARTSARFGRIERQWRATPGTAASLPRFLERAEWRLESASGSLAQFEPLRRQLRAVAEQRLARHGSRLGSERSRHLLGQESSLLLEPARDNRSAPGPGPDELARLLARLEQL